MLASILKCMPEVLWFAESRFSKMASLGVCLHSLRFESSNELRVSGRDDVPLPYQGGVDGGSLEDRVKGKGGWGRRGAPGTAGTMGLPKLMCVWHSKLTL